MLAQLWAVLAMGGGMLGFGPGVPPASAASCSPWIVQSTPGPSGGSGAVLEKISARTTTDVWGAGYYQTVIGQQVVHQTLIEHFNGTSWGISASPNVSSTPSARELFADNVRNRSASLARAISSLAHPSRWRRQLAAAIPPLRAYLKEGLAPRPGRTCSCSSGCPSFPW